MKKNWLLAVGLVLVLAIVGLAGCQPSGTVQGVSIQQEGIWVSGQGKVTAVPDIATLSLGIEAQEASVADAQSKATEARNKGEQLATLAEVKLGKPTYISEGISYPIYPRDYTYEMVGGALETPISPGEMEISLDIQVVYAILD